MYARIKAHAFKRLLWLLCSDPAILNISSQLFDWYLPKIQGVWSLSLTFGHDINECRFLLRVKVEGKMSRVQKMSGNFLFENLKTVRATHGEHKTASYFAEICKHLFTCIYTWLKKHCRIKMINHGSLGIEKTAFGNKTTYISHYHNNYRIIKNILYKCFTKKINLYCCN